MVRSSCGAVWISAWVSSTPSSTCPAKRVTARTFEYDNRPDANAASINGSSGSVRATRRYSRATPGDTAHAQDSQCEHDTMPQPLHPLRSSNSASRRSQSCICMASRPANEQIRPSNSFSDSPDGPASALGAASALTVNGADGTDDDCPGSCSSVSTQVIDAITAFALTVTPCSNKRSTARDTINPAPDSPLGNGDQPDRYSLAPTLRGFNGNVLPGPDRLAHVSTET